MAQASHAATAVLHFYREEESVKEYLEDLQGMRKVSSNHLLSSALDPSSSFPRLVTFADFVTSYRSCSSFIKSVASSLDLHRAFSTKLTSQWIYLNRPQLSTRSLPSPPTSRQQHRRSSTISSVKIPFSLSEPAHEVVFADHFASRLLLSSAVD